jgi:hypothetical protein
MSDATIIEGAKIKAGCDSFNHVFDYRIFIG